MILRGASSGELRRLTELRDRLAVFADRDPTAALVAGVIGGGIGRTTMSVAVIDFMSRFDSPERAHEVACSPAWVLDVVAAGGA